MKLKAGDIVKLKDRAVKEFFGTEECVSLYEEIKSGSMTSEGFVRYVSDTIAFHNGKGCGVVIGFSTSDMEIAKVSYFSNILGWRTRFYGEYDLEVVKSWDL